MNYATIKKFDIANGLGVRVSLFVSGCTHHCKGCFNSEAWDFNYGVPFTDGTIDEIISACKPDYIEGLSLLGGEPFEPQNQVGLIPLLERFKSEFPNKDVWCYTGYLFDKDLCSGRVGGENAKKMLEYIDILVDGKFIEEQKNLRLKFKGSKNQRIINVSKSLLNGEIVLWEGDKENNKL